MTVEEYGLGQPQLLRPPIHPLHKSFLRPVDGLSQTQRAFVTGRQQQAGQ